MNKFALRAFHLLLLAISLAALAAAANAQPSLRFSDARRGVVEFTKFGTIIYPNQNLVTRGYEIVYNVQNDGSGRRRAWYIDSLHNSGIVPVSLSADQPNGHTLRDDEPAYVRVVVRTSDNKLKITFRYLIKGNSPVIETVVTIENDSHSSIDLGGMSFINPLIPECQCPCHPVREFDGATVHSSIITIAPNVRYRRTTANFTDTPTLNRNDSRDIPGCDPRADVPIGPGN